MLKGKVHPEIKLVLIGVEKMRETSQWKFEQIPIKNKEVRIF